MKVLVTGAAGYIGSVVTDRLVELGREVIALDNLQHGHRAAVSTHAAFLQGDLLNADWLTQILRTHRVDAVVHLAAEALIDESLRDPGRFFRANVCGGLNLLEAMAAAGVEHMVYSSSAAVYGEPAGVPIKEDAPLVPVNSYGESKLAFERMLPWYRKAHGLRHISLRYFNVCGATALRGEWHVPETHLIPIIFEAALGQRDAIYLFGTDYDTPDGTCIRDYVHVADIAEAHVLALQNIDRIEAAAYNMGNGSGYSNLDVIETVRRVTGKDFVVTSAPRRPGDPARLVATSHAIREDLGWHPTHADLASMVQAAWDWRMQHPAGYEE